MLRLKRIKFYTASNQAAKNIGHLKLFIFVLLFLSLFSTLPAQLPPGIDENELYKNGLLDVTLFGADSTGVLVSTDAIQTAVNVARDNSLICYFPSGTYLVDDTIKCMKPSIFRNNRWEEQNRYCVLVGSSDKRPLIKLVPGAAAFQDPEKPIAVFWFWSMCFYAGNCSEACMGNEDPNCNNSAINYNQSFRNIDIDLGGNPGAAGIKHAAAQGASIEDVKINATGAFAGLYNPTGGVAGGVFNIEVEGGMYGIYYKWREPFLGWNVNQGNYPVLSGCVFKNQEIAPFYLDLAHPMVVAGFHIVKSSGSINQLLKGNGISLIDGVIEIGGGQVISGNTANIYMNNVYVKGATSIANNWSVADPGSWTCVNEYSYSSGSSTNLLDGMLNKTEIRNKTENITLDAEDLVRELRMKHIWDNDAFPDYESTGFVNVKDASKMNDLPAKGDGTTDDTNALEYAIANYNTIFLPKGTYQISRSLTLKKNTMIFGTHRTYSVIRGANITTVDDADASSSLAHLAVRSGTVLWKAGMKSMVRSISLGNINISGNGGGRWYAPFNVGSRTTIIGTTQPLAIYGFNPERAADPQTEIKDAENVRLYFVKTEAGVGGQGNSGGHNSTIRITNSKNIAVFSCLGNVTLSEDKGMIEVINSTDILATHVRGFQTGPDWYEIKETYNGITTGVRSGTTLSTFKRGAITVDVQNNTNQSYFDIYPNPSRDYVTVYKRDMQGPVDYRIFDIHGKQMDSGSISSNYASIDLPPLPGMYFISVSDHNNMAFKRIIKQ